MAKKPSPSERNSTKMSEDFQDPQSRLMGVPTLWGGGGSSAQISKSYGPSVKYLSKESRENTLNWSCEIPEMVDFLFEGTSAGGSGDYAKNCEKGGGEIYGDGPDCSHNFEEAAQDIARCFYEHTQECIRALRSSVYSSARMFSTEMTRASNEYEVQAPPPENPTRSSRLAYTKAMNEFEDCREKITNECECKDCRWTYYTDKDEVDTDTDIDDNDDDGSVLPTYDSFSTTSSTGVIPRMWGRYVLGGNIIWLGEKLYKNMTRYIAGTSGSVPVTEVRESFVDVFLGLCAGKTKSLLRVFVGDAPVYNTMIDENDVEGSTRGAFDFSFSVNSPEDMELLQYSNPKFHLRTGEETQKIVKKHAVSKGFGRVPAYRGLSFMYMEEIDVRLLGGSFPDVRVDLTTEDVLPQSHTVTSPASATTAPHVLTVDLLNNVVITEDTDGSIVTRDWTSLEELGRFAQPQESTKVPTVYGNVIVMDPTTSPVMARYVETMGGQTRNQDTLYMYPWVTTPSPERVLMKPFKRISAEDYAPRDSVAFTSSDGTMAIMEFSPSGVGPITLQQLDGFGIADHVPVNDALVSINQELHYVVFYLKETGQNDLQIRYNKVRPSAITELTFDVSTNGGTIVTAVPNTTVWGSATSNVSLLNVVVTRDNALLLFIKAGADYKIVRMDPKTWTVDWRIDVPYTWGRWNNTGICHGAPTTAFLHFLTNENVLVQLHTPTGVLTELGDTTSLDMPEYEAGAAQYYDYATNSLTYITVAGEVTRTFFSRQVLGGDPNVAQVIQDCARFARYPDWYVDASLLSTLTFKGFAINDMWSFQNVITHLQELYGFSIVDSGRAIELNLNPYANPPIALDAPYDLISSKPLISYVTQESKTDTVQISFMTFTPAGMEESLQIFSLRGDDLVDAPKIHKVTTKISDTPENIRKRAEILLERLRSEERVYEVELMPRRMGITPQDQILHEDRVYTINSTETAPGETTSIVAGESIADKLDVLIDIAAVTLNTAPPTVVTPSRRGLHPTVLYTNALTEEHSTQSVQGQQVAYAYIEAHQETFEPARVSVFVHKHLQYIITGRGSDTYITRTIPESPIYRSEEISKSAYIGRILLPPKWTRPARVTFGEITYVDATVSSQTSYSNPLTVMDAGGSSVILKGRTNFLSSDPKDYIRVRFNRPDVVDLFKVVEAPYYELRETPLENLLIVGREYIQFGSFEVHPDDPHVITFSNLFRGTMGTDSYVNHVPQEERVVFYTPDTVKPIVMDSAYTKRNAASYAWVPQVLPAGASSPEYGFVTDAGASRPWPPTSAQLFAHGGDQTKLTVGFKRRQPFLIPFEEAGGAIPNSYNSTSYIVLDDFDALTAPIIDIEHTYSDYDPGLVVEYNAGGAPVLDFTFTPSVFDLHPITCFMIGRDSAGQAILGIPHVTITARGRGSTYPSAP